jgi:hypothetical protein
MASPARPSRSRRPRVRAALAGGLAAALLLAGCGGDDGAPESGDAAQSSEKADRTKSGASAEADLASGLLTADAFGPDAAVVSVSPEQLEQGAGLAGSLGDVEVTPAECDAAVEGTQPDIGDFDDIAAVSAQSGTTVTVEMLVRGGPTEGTVDQLADAVQRCPTAQISSPQIGTATITFEGLDVADLGDGAAGLRYTTAVALPDGTQASVPALIGAVEDGDRLLVLMSLVVDTTGQGAAPLDPAAFAALLEEAYQVQADALG